MKTSLQTIALGCLCLAIVLPAAVIAQEVVNTSLKSFGQLTEAELETLRKKYAFRSVRDRLRYEPNPSDDAKPSLPDETEKAMEWMDGAYDTRRVTPWAVRSKSLQLLHEGEAKDFAKRPGFGASRVPAPSPRYFELPSATPVPFAKLKVESATEDSMPLVKLPKLKKTVRPNPLRLPSQELLGYFHQGSQFNFVSPTSLGYVKGRDQVAGFMSHQFYSEPQLSHYMPQPPPKEHPKEKWQLRRLQLVGLLKHEKPVAYVSKHLPRMEDLENAAVRRLDTFEQNGLAELQQGKQIVTQATPNRIYMLGALRAGKQCTECHSVKRGDLLGAFSYELWRDPQIKAEALKKLALY